LQEFQGKLGNPPPPPLFDFLPIVNLSGPKLKWW
jgi:hypothetical protein